MAYSLTDWLVNNPTGNGSGANPYNSFTSIVATNTTNIVNLYNVLCAPSFLQLIPSLFTSPSQWISGCMLFPFSVPVIENTAWKYLKIGPVDTHTLSPAEYVRVKETTLSVFNHLIDLGSSYITPYFNNFLDYNGYTKIECYLPYLGYVELLPNDVMGKYVFVNLYIDYYSGQGLYYISVADTSSAPYAERRIIVKKEVQLGIKIPLGSTDANERIRDIILGSVKTMTDVAVLGVMSYSISKTTRSPRTSDTVIKRKNLKTGRMYKYATRHTDYSGSETEGLRVMGGARAATTATNGTIGSLEGMHMTVNSDMLSNALLDMAGPKSVKIIIKRPKIVYERDAYYKHLFGLPLNRIVRLSTLSGYTKIGSTTRFNMVNVFNSITQDELDLLEQTITGGIIL